jgi:alkylation response protein AidB-like acyl-CoA dehydrogenase
VRVGIAVTREQVALQRSVRQWADGAKLPDVVRAREIRPERHDDLDRRHQQAAALGLVAAGLPEDLGGSGKVADAAAALEAAAAALVPGPLLPTVLAAHLLVPAAGPAARLVPDLADGTARAAVALEPGELEAVREPDGGLRVSGTVDAVLGAAGDTHLVLAARDAGGHEDVWFTVAPGTPGLTLTDRRPLDFSRDVADVALDGVRVPAGDVLPAGTDDVRDLAVTLAAAEAAGVAAWCVDVAAGYAKVREQFGRPIGSFQAVKHLCAGMLCHREEAVAVAWDAARVRDEPDAGGQRAIAAAVAGAVALDAAVETAKTCVQVLGGIGFTWEHDAHLYLRRAHALRQWAGGGAAWRRRVAALTHEGVRRRPALEVPEPPPGDTTAADVRAVIAGLPDEPAERRVRLADSGYLMPHWPVPYGRGAGAREQLVIAAELDAAGIVRPDIVIGGWAVPTIVRHGDDAQRDRFVGPTLRGEIVWCQLFSEPGAGSDLAALRTRAERVEGGWALTGQKVWTSLAQVADWGICLARTNPDAPLHQGITYFLVDMRAPGIEVRPLREITGEERFNEVFLDAVFVPDECVVGPVGGGWKLARTTLAEERVAIGGNPTISGRLELLVADGDAARALGGDRVGGLVGQGTAVELISLIATARRLAAEAGAASDAGPGAESAVTKLLGVRHRQDVAEAAYEALGPAGLAFDAATDGAAADGTPADVAHEMLVTRALSIAGGTTQVLMTLAGERILGLPRERRA